MPIVCAKCRIGKQLNDYKLDEQGVPFDICIQCWNINSALFWSTKHFRICKSCDEKLPIDKRFRKNQYGIPYAICVTCYETKVQEDYRKLRASRILPFEAIGKKVPLPEPKVPSKIILLRR